MSAPPIRIAAISGSLRKGSYNTALLRAARDLAPKGVEVEILSIAGLPVYDADLQAEGMPEAVLALQKAIGGADGVLISSPEYNYSVPGGLKNAIDWLSRTDPQPFAEKPVAIMGASPGKVGTARMQYHLRQIFVFLRARLLSHPEVMVGSAHERITDGELTDEGTRSYLGKLVGALVSEIEDRRRLAR